MLGDVQPTDPPSVEDLARLEELAAVAAEKSTLESEKMNDKAVRNLMKTISECKQTAEGEVSKLSIVQFYDSLYMAIPGISGAQSTRLSGIGWVLSFRSESANRLYKLFTISP